jgi:hypothetical protein
VSSNEWHYGVASALLNNDFSWTLPTCFVQLLMGWTHQNLCHHGGPFDQYIYKRMIADYAMWVLTGKILPIKIG